MKRRTSKRMIAGVLAICIMAGTPTNLCPVEAAAPAGIDNMQPVDTDTDTEEFGSVSAEGWKIEPESEHSECIDSEESTESGNAEESSESSSLEEESTYPESEMPCGFEPLTAEAIQLLGEESPDLEAGVPETDTEAEMAMDAHIEADITDDGVFDYRTYIAGDKKPGIQIQITDMHRGTELSVLGHQGQSGWKPTNLDERFADVACNIKINDKHVVSIDGASQDKKESSESKAQKYSTTEREIALDINRVGKTTIQIGAPDSRYTIEGLTCDITVKNSPLKDEDFYIEVCRYDAEKGYRPVVTRYSYEEWIAYLKEHDNWVNGTITPKLSAVGKKYYSEINLEAEKKTEDESSDGLSEDTAGDRQSYVLWAEHPDRNASTKSVENGTRKFVAGIDRQAPSIEALATESVCYEPTRTETEQYYADDFVLTGSVSDEGSGLAKVEYTTDFMSDEHAVWSQASVSDDTFRITLPDGCYGAIAVRAYDNAGNRSGAKLYANDKGNPIKVIVDKSEPIMNITAKSGNTEYDGADDNWTNQNVVYDVTSAEASCPYAGIYQCEYAYEPIGEAVNKNMTDMSEKWTGISLDKNSSGRLEVTDDRNGYYYFRAVSKSGVQSKEAAKCRILIQHQVADIKPVEVNGVDATKCKNDWYNKASGVPVIRFEYPDYDNGVISGEYDAPVTIHYTLTAQADDDSTEQVIEDNEKNNAVLGIMSSERVRTNAEGKKEFILTKDDLGSHQITFDYDEKSGYARDGIYTLEYWVTDKAGNKSEKQTSIYKIDCHEPTDLRVVVADQEMPADSEASIVYERFYKEAISGDASAQYGISGKGSIKILRTKKPGEWEDIDVSALDDGDRFDIVPNTRCFLYVRAEDQAGNYTQGWTRGLVVDNMLPNQSSGKELVVEPEGANEHGFFNQDVKVKISVKDSPEDDNCAALMSVNSSVGKDGTDTISDKELFAFTKEFPTDDELTNASSFEMVQTIDAKANESNNAYIEVTAVDRSENSKTSTQILKIDVTKPVVTITFDRENGVNGRFYNESRTATIHVQELNFDASNVEMAITRNGEPIEMPLSDWISDGSEHYANVVFEQDGDYTMEVRCTDLADNESETAQAEGFTIDRTAPQVTIDLIPQADMQVHSEGYYGCGVTAQITVTEHNFREDDFAFDSTPAAPKLAWKHEGDVHTASMAFESDNEYLIRCAYTDLAGNAADAEGLTKEFVIDRTAPMLAIAGVTDGSANSGEVTPVITVLDLNLAADAVGISVVTGRGQLIENTIETAVIDDGSGVGYIFTLTDMTDKADDIYYLTVTACDKAGNDAELTYRFSLNRNGSAYDFADLIRLMENQYNAYIGMDDIMITEMNVDLVDEFEVYISRNGALGYKAAYEKEVQGSDNIGYTYTYRIKRENFAEEGSYRLSMYSKDRAGNEVNNSIAVQGKEVEFIIDNTSPKVVIDGVETGKVYDVEAQEVGIVVTDNFKLAEAEFTLVNKKNEVLERWNYMDLSKEGDTLYITIPEYKEEVSLLYRIKDAAGNEVQTFRGESTALADFLVTTDKFVQFVNKPTQTPFGCTLLVLMGMIGISAIVISALLLRKRKRG